MEILKMKGFPLNTSQLCRILHGAEHQHDITFCRASAYHTFRDPEGFKDRGNNCLYTGCKSCNPGYGSIYAGLYNLEKKGWLETRKEYRTDPIVPGAKDWMRMWYFKGKMPSMDHFTVDETKKRT